jgi:hypothetical protein
MKARDALKLHKGDEVVDKVTGESIYVICAFEDYILPGKKGKCVMIEGTGEKQGYNHWQHTTVR